MPRCVREHSGRSQSIVITGGEFKAPALWRLLPTMGLRTCHGFFQWDSPASTTRNDRQNSWAGRQSHGPKGPIPDRDWARVGQAVGLPSPTIPMRSAKSSPVLPAQCWPRTCEGGVPVVGSLELHQQSRRRSGRRQKISCRPMPSGARLDAVPGTPR